MHSIQTKFTILLMSCILLSAVALGGIGVFYVGHLADQNMDNVLELTCKEQGAKIDRLFREISFSVDYAAFYALEELMDLDSFLGEVSYRDEYTERMEQVFRQIAEKIDGDISYYMRYNPEITSSQEGLFFVKNAAGQYVRQELTVLDAYAKDNEGYARWYQEPMAVKKAVWIEPYVNESIGVHMISYVVPLYKEEVFIGVVGMDIDFTQVEKWIDKIKVGETGRAFLASREGEIIYSSKDSEKNATGVIKDYTNTRSFLCSLENEMFLGLEVSEIEIIEKKIELVGVIVITVVVLIILFFIITIMITGKIIRPLKKLTLAAEKISEGDFDVELACSTQDEVMVLTRSIEKMVEQLNRHITYIENLAYIDALTGMKNKTAYDEEVQQKKQAMEKTNYSFAVAVIDVNDLKKVNDNLGHEEGDKLLKKFAEIVQEVFTSQSIYRIGGDEFVLFLEAECFPTMEQLFEKLEQELEETKLSSLPVSAAWGIAIYDEFSFISYETLFRQADKAMYERKKKMKKESLKTSE